MELSDYLAVLRDRWRVIALLTAIMTLAGAVVTYVTVPTYQSTAQVFVSFQPSDPSTSALVSGSTFTQNQIASYVDLATSPVVLDPVIQELGLPVSANILAGDIEVSSPADTVLMNVTATAESGQRAADIANAVAGSLTQVIPEIERPEGATTSPVKLTVSRVAGVPSAPSAPNTPLNIGLGVIAGLVLGLGVALLRNGLDTKVRSESDVAAVTSVPVIGSIGFDDDATDHPLIVQTSPHSTRSEAFRRLRTNLQFLDVGSDGRAIVISSAAPGEGKSTTSVNLAISLADAGSRVVLVDADLRRPSIADYMGLEGQVGLTTILIGRATLDDVRQPWGNGRLHIVTSGEIPPNPSELLGSHAMSTLIKELSERYDVVLLDTAPLLPVTDGAVLARLSAGALVVAASDKIHRAQLSQAIGRLTEVDARVLGVVLNRVALKNMDSYTYYDYAGATTSRDSSRAKKSRASSRSGKSRERQVFRPRHTHATRTVTTSKDPESDTPAIGVDKSTWPGGRLSGDTD